jgi:hypothetical protein
MLVALHGCASKATNPPGLPVPGPGTASQADAPGQTQQAVVYFRGFVRKSFVPWIEDLTLAKAILQAEYTGQWDPHLITITRQGRVFHVNPKRLLSGLDDPALEPGDIVEVQR